MSQQKSYAAALRGDDGGAAAAVSPAQREGRDGRDGLGLSCPEGDDSRMNMDVQSWDYEYSMHTLNILSLNVNGLNSAVKRTRVLEYLHRKSISCALIQETHLKQSDVACFQNKYYKLIAFSCAQNKTKGVLILVNRKLNLTIEHLGSDEKGRFVFIRCKIYNNRLALVSIYGPNETDSLRQTDRFRLSHVI